MELYKTNTEWLESIKRGFATSIQGNHVSLEWADELQEYLSMKYHLPVSDRIWFIRMLYYSLGEDMNLNRIFIKNCVRAFGNKRDLDQDCGLVLDWKVLYDLVERIVQSKTGNSEVSIQLLPHLLNLVDLASRFFEPSETKKILEKIVPEMNLTCTKAYIAQIAKLAYFLPVNSDLEWLPMLFKWWEVTTNSPEQNMYYLYLLSRISVSKLTSPAHYLESHVEHLFTVALKVLELEVGEPMNRELAPSVFDRDVVMLDSGAFTFIHSSDIPECFFVDQLLSLAQIIACNLFEESDRVSFLEPLEKLFLAIEPFCHPSNVGVWTTGIYRFLFHFSWTLLYRKNTQKGKKYLLTQNLMNKICTMVLPLLEFGSFGKLESCLDQAHSAMKCWAWMAPDIVFPKILPDIYSSLENLNETHRAEASLALLSLTVNPMLRKGHYPPGKKELFRILELTLPSININDERKTFMACYLFIASLCNVPIVDTSAYADNYMDEEDKQACLSTSKCQPLMEGLIESMFACFRNLPETIVNQSNPTNNALGLLCEFVFPQLSPELEDFVLEKLKNHIDNVIPHALDAIALVCGVWSGKAPEKKLAAFLPLCMKRILEELQHGVCSMKGSNPNNPVGMASLSDARFHWYQEILLRMFAYSGKDLLLYKDTIVMVLDEMLDKCVSVQGYTSAGTCLGNLLHSLTERYPIGFASHPSKCWRDPEFLQNSIEHWGEPVNKKALPIDWHYPTPEEIEFAWFLVQRYHQKATAELKTLMEMPTDTDIEKQETYHLITKWIAILQNCLSSMILIVQPKEYSLPPLSAYCYYFRSSPLQCHWAVNAAHPLHEAFHQVLETIMSQVVEILEFLLSRTPDNTDGLLSAIMCMEVSLSFKFYIQQEVAIVKSLKPIQVVPADPTVYCRPIRVSEHYTLGLKRKLYTRRMAGLCPIRLRMMELLVRLSICHYTEVRIQAQSSLFQALSDHLYLANTVTQRIGEYLQSAENSDAMKGCLYVLQNSMLLENISLNREVYYDISLTLFKLRGTDGLKDSVISLIDDVLQHFNARCDFTTDDLVLSEILVDEAKKFEVDLGLVGTIQKFRDERVVMLTQKRREYVQALLQFVNQDFHWSTGSNVVQILYLIQHSKEPPSAPIADFAFRNSLNEHLQVREQSVVLLNEILITCKRRSKLGGHFAGARIKHLLDPTSSEFEGMDLELENKSTGFIDDVLLGWIMYPNPTKVYKGYFEGNAIDDPLFLPVAEICCKYIYDESFWREFVRLCSLETTDGLPEFNYELAQLMSTIGLLFQSKHLGFVLPILEGLVHKTGELIAHKVAAELICGILYGAKHWADSEKQKIVDNVYPLLMTGVANCPIEAIASYKEIFGIVFERRDPKRFSELVDLFLAELRTYDPSMSYVRQSKKISFINILLSSSRMPSSFYEKCIKMYVEMGSNPYQEVREALGSGIDFALLGLSRPFRKEDMGIEKLMDRETWSSEPYSFMMEFLDKNLEMNVPVLGNQFNSNTAKFSIID
jgi:proteasome activator subunit 4